jgi:transposase
MAVSKVGAGAQRRTWSLEERQQIVGEALAAGASVAAVARRHGLNANLVFKWIRRAREGWLDRRRTPAKDIAASIMSEAESAAPAFVPVKLVELNAVAAPALTPPPVVTKPVRATRRTQCGMMEISLPNGARVSLDADVDAEALRRVLSVLGDL